MTKMLYIKSTFIALLGSVFFHASAQSLSEQFKESERKQDFEKMKKEDTAFIKEELLRRQGISPEQLIANGKVLVCDFPGTLRNQFGDLESYKMSAIQGIRRDYVLIDGKIVNPKARTNESFSVHAVAPKVVGSLVINNGILKPMFNGPSMVDWEVNATTGEAFVRGARSQKVYKAKCTLAAYKPQN